MAGGAYKHDVAIFAPWAGPLYAPGSTVPTGGAERQSWYLAHALAERGLRVCHVVFEVGGIVPDDQVSVLSIRTDAWRRHFTLYARDVAAALRRADAAVYVQRTASFDTGAVAAAARLFRRRFVFSSSSSTDLARRPPLPTPQAGASYAIGVRLADAIVVQTEEQRTLAERHLRRRPNVIPSFCALPTETSRLRDRFLWVGRLVDYKDPLAFAELARRLPSARFTMVAAPGETDDEELSRRMEEALEALPNLEVLQPRSQEEVLALYEQSVALVNTSRFEGFPNTFMEAWARGAPTLSLRVDPDGVIETHGLGASAGGSIEGLTEEARRLWERGDRDAHAATTRSYVEARHNPPAVAQHWIELLGALMNGGVPAARGGGSAVV